MYKQWLGTKENLNSAFQLSKEELAQDKINVDSLQKKADEYERLLSQKAHCSARIAQRELPLTKPYSNH
ncbi:MAG: hypothetical protein IPJ60_03195 [Sphingobacteriaceae bacterium]|nr:hypothetical protein [Sphingobacteriaceae bacterium]